MENIDKYSRELIYNLMTGCENTRGFISSVDETAFTTPCAPEYCEQCKTDVLTWFEVVS